MLEREQYVKLLAPYHPHYGTGAAFAEEHIRQDVASHLTGQNNGQSGQTGPYGGGNGRRYAPAPLPQPPSGGGATEQAERHLLRAMVSDDPALAGPALTSITPDEFVTERARALALFVQGQYREGQPLDPKEVLAALGDDPRADLLADLLMNSGDEPLLPEALAGEIEYLKDCAKEQMLSALKQRILEGTADTETLRQFARLQSELRGTPKSPAAGEGK